MLPPLAYITLLAILLTCVLGELCGDGNIHTYILAERRRCLPIWLLASPNSSLLRTYKRQNSYGKSKKKLPDLDGAENDQIFYIVQTALLFISQHQTGGV